MSIHCHATPCPIILSAECVHYEGPNLVYSGIQTNDNLEVILGKLDVIIQNSGIVESDPIFEAWLAATPPLYSFTETDPVFSAWDKSTGISITESQISDLQPYLLSISGEDLSTADNSTSQFITLADIPAIPSDISELTDNTNIIPTDTNDLTNGAGYITAGDVPIDPDEKVKYNAGDPTAGYIEDKIIAGTGISVAEGAGADENKLIITNNDTGSGAVATHEGTYDHTLIATALQAETDPNFNNWLSNTPPAYPGDIPDVSSFLDETEHDLLDHAGLTGIHAQYSDAETSGTIATIINGVSTDTIADADTVPWYQVIGGALKKITWSNIKTTLATYFNGLYFPLSNNTLMKDPTGFIDPDNVSVSYDATNRTITLTHSSGYVQYMWNGVLKQLTSPWTSTPHTDDSLTKFLSTIDGTNFLWADSSWELDDLQVAYVVPGKIFGLRETHGILQWKMHELWHLHIGTLRRTGGGLVAGTFSLQPGSPTNANNTPSFAACTISDEDNDTLLPLWTEDTYTTLWFTSSGTANWSTVATLMLRVTGTYPNINTWNGSTFAETETVNGRYFNSYVIRFPVTSDVESQKYRAVCLQPQLVYTSLASAQAEEFKSLYLGELSTLAPEFVAVERITWRTNSAYNSATGRVRIEAHAILVGSKSSQVAVAGITPTTAENVSFSPSGGVAAVNVQAAIEELDTEKQATLTFGIADTNKVQIDHASVADNDYAKFTANGLEGRSYAEVRSDCEVPLSQEILTIKQMTAADYAALVTKVSTTLYIIVG